MSDVQAIAPVLGVMFLMVVPVAIVYLVLRHRHRVTAMKLKAAVDFTERGAAVPFELLLEKPRTPINTDLRLGMVLTCIGIGAVLFALTLREHSLWGLGLLPLFAGIGYLITWKLSHRTAAPGQDG